MFNIVHTYKNVAPLIFKQQKEYLYVDSRYGDIRNLIHYIEYEHTPAIGNYEILLK